MNHVLKFRSILSVTTSILALFVVSPITGAAESKIVDGVAAVVNGEVITFSSVQELVAARERALAATYSGDEYVAKVKELRLAALKDLIDRTLIVQEFNKQGMKMPDYIVDDHINTVIRDEFGGDKQAFLRTLAAQGYTLAKFRKIEEDKIIVQAMRSRFVKGNFIASPTRVNEFYSKNAEQFRTPEQLKLRMITIYKGEDSAAENNRKIAGEIRAKIKSTEDFERMALMYSEDSMREDGGDWGWIDRGTLNEELAKLAFNMKPGAVSDVVDGGDAFYILMVEARKDATVKPLKEVRGDIEQKIVQVQKQEAMQKWIDTLRGKAYIKMF
jgi:peptidyl-prolyl cis-trans isomerase SurA